MGRKAIGEVSEDAKAMDALAEENRKHDEMVKADDKRFLEEGEEFNVHVCLEKARIYQEQMATGMLGLGAQLILLKNHLDHGEFLAAVEELGLTPRAAQFAMSAARKFGANASLTTHLENIGTEKLKALTVLDDDVAHDFAEGKEVAGIGSVDDVAQMTVKELRETLRKVRKERQEERDAQEKVIAEKNDKLNEMEAHLRYQQPPTREQMALAELTPLKKDYTVQIASAIDAFRKSVALVKQAQSIEGVTLDQLEVFRMPEGDEDGIFVLMCSLYEELNDLVDNIHPTFNSAAGDEK